MAWRSSGDTNEEMVNNLNKYGVISSDFIEKGFRNVDRKYFVPKGNEGSAYSDQPLKEGHVHISAPHIYGAALEALELQPNSSLSFCNIGSGTGYLSCIVAEVLGPKSVNYGVEIHQGVVEHCNASISEWKESKKNKANHPQHFAHLQIVHGNALNVSSSSGESLVGFDRIYIGASVSKTNLPRITKLLSPGGILVGPVDDELVKIVRIGPLSQLDKSMTSYASSDSDDDSVDYNPRSIPGDIFNVNNEFTQQILSGVRFASLINLPATETILRARLWSPNLQQFFPDSFQNASMEILLCSNSGYIQPLPTPKPPEGRVNLAAILPKVIWLEILSYTHRKWFDSKETETEFLKKRLLEEQVNAAKAKQALVDAEERCHVAERERDVYRLLARRWQSRLQLVLLQERHVVESGAMPPLPSLMSNNDGTNDNPNLEENTAGSLDALLPPVQNDNVSLEEGAHSDLYFSAQDSSTFMEDDEERDTAMIVHEHQQLIGFLEHHNSDDEYDFQSLHSDHNEDTLQDVGAHRNENEQDDNESVTMDDASVVSEDAGHIQNFTSKGQTSPTQIQGREIRTVSMCSDDI